MMPCGYPPQIFWPQRPLTFIHCVSDFQRLFCRASAPLLPAIRNGVPVERLATRVSKDDFVISIGRISREKGFHIALDAAKRAGVAMILAGPPSR
jgi:glycosyltransferase involved in cell wall biosynthesis